MDAMTESRFDADTLYKLADMFNSPFRDEADKLLRLALADLRNEHNLICDQFGEAGYAKLRRDECARLRYDLKRAFALYAEGELKADELHDFIARIVDRSSEIADDMRNNGHVPFETVPPPPGAAPPTSSHFSDFHFPEQAPLVEPDRQPDFSDDEDSDETPEAHSLGEIPEAHERDELDCLIYGIAWYALAVFTWLSVGRWLGVGHPPTVEDWLHLVTSRDIILIGFVGIPLACFATWVVTASIYGIFLSDTDAGDWVVDRLCSIPVVAGAWTSVPGFFFCAPLNPRLPEFALGGFPSVAVGVVVGVALLWLLRKALPIFGFVGLSLKVALAVDGLFVVYVVGFREAPFRVMRGGSFPSLAEPIYPFIIASVLATGLLIMPEVTEWFRQKTSRMRLVFFTAAVLVSISVLAIWNPVKPPSPAQNVVVPSSSQPAKANSGALDPMSPLCVVGKIPCSTFFKIPPHNH